ncbi:MULTISPECIES: helix-turn-helix transcriptional regulator [Myroides]|uniref:helix-turn-helix transcriptional regulator n=1 Tax=Myroides TaxID=76831 RepID=UPI0015F94712|nr:MULTISPECIES: helix-turn-helix domain-containing protein [Myroides]MBB1149692.1 helix-turn-helix domain-containing protein [Myroides sp. NP-2]MDM1059759.1 helix-turn-helix domain-containing protein [Myroides odoratimimus]MDM1537653.1 helix-turn-helix domain-containing protein [Myroides odoratimimus]MDM1677208.1 helix-turn-helix domain-containing protein [Myroides odoratimimus]MEC4077542.1 helix-turn-helix domain-containing protein [Myroides odoratimimus]
MKTMESKDVRKENVVQLQQILLQTIEEFSAFKNQIIHQQRELKEAIGLNMIQQKEMLNVQELSEYIGMSTSSIYKLVYNNKIPNYKPNGKILYFDREEINTWLRQNKSQSISQIQQQALDYSFKNRKK